MSTLTVRLGVRRPWVWLVAALLLAAGILQANKTADLDGAQKTAIPFPSLVYDIEAESNGHQASILNLGIGYVGALQAPIPVDVDGDLLPDVTVAVNLLDTQGIHNPPQVGDIIRPNVEINRFPLELGTTLLGRPSPPLRINVALDIIDLQGEEDTMTARFGYDTGLGGSIPGFFQATVDGLENFFNPVTATISTKGDLITQSSQPLWYRGPLTIIGGFEQGAFDADLDLRYAPFPDEIAVTYLHDDAGDHIDYSHAYDGEVDLLANAVIEDEGSRIDTAARIDRLPRQLGVDMADTEDGGAIHFDTSADGRLPDVDVRFRGPLLDDVFDAHLAIEDLPTSMDAAWSMPDDGPVSASFDSSGQGIGSIEALITNKDGNPQGLPAFAFTEKQIVAAHLKALDDGTQAMRLGARIERIREATVTASPDGGLDANIQIGDGELPLELSGSLDLRADDGPFVKATSVLSPLPGNVNVALVPAGANGQTDPMTLRYESSESVDVDADVRVVDPASPTNATACGQAGVLCGDLRIRHIPGGILAPDDRLGSIEARIGDFENAAGKHESRIEVDSDGPSRPDFFADVSIGPGVIDGPAQLEGRPLVAHAEVLGLAKHLYVRTVEGQDQTLQRAEFHTCIRDYALNAGDGACVPDPLDEADPRIGALEFSLSNFLPEDRNDANVQVPSAYAATPNFATITARGHDAGSSVAFEATGRMQDIREVLYINQGAFGVRTDIGGNAPLAALVDVKDIAFGEPDGRGVNPPIFDIKGDVLIDPLPRLITVCLNASGQDIVTPVADVTEACQDANPFDDGPALDKSPLSFAYDGEMKPGEPQEFNVDADAELLDHGKDRDRAAVDDNRTVRGHLEIDHIPAKIRAHVLDPADQVEEGEPPSGPLRVLVDAPTLGPQLTVFASAALLDGDLQCQDPRVPKRLDEDTTQSAICAQGRINNVPEHLTLDYDPAVPVDNFVLDSTGEKQLDLVDLGVSSVTRNEPDDYPISPARAQILIAEGEILDLPRKVSGTLQTPAPDQPNDPVLIDLSASAPDGDEFLVGGVNATVRNFIAPDPIPDMPAQRSGLPPQPVGDDLLDPTDNFDWASFVQRGDAFQGEIHISQVKRVGFKNQVDADGDRLDTNVVNVDFGQDKTVRGYVDIDLDGSDRIIGDVTLTDVPAGLQVCFRNPTTLDNPAKPGTATFCDTTPATAADRQKLGAFEARMTSAVGAELDVDAFVRAARGGGTDVLAARLDVDNIPNVIKGTFGDGQVDVGGFKLNGKADGIDRIWAHAASFDIKDDGWSAGNRPYAPRFVTKSPFPAPEPNAQHVAVRADDTDFELRTRIGETGDNMGSASDLHRVRLSTDPCTRPQGVDYDQAGTPAFYGTRPDFPVLPVEPGTEHTCIRADFKPDGPGADPLDLSAVIDQNGRHIALRDAGLTDIPDFVQVNLADVENPLQPGTGDDPRRMRPHCAGTGYAQPANCVAPLIRADTPGTTTLFGVVEIGTLSDIAHLQTVVPRETIPAPVEPSGWGDETGVRARIGQYEDRSVFQAGIKIPIPASLTVDQVQTWGQSDVTLGRYHDASDLHFRYAARNPDGSTIADLGRLSAMIHSFVDGGQIMLSDDDPGLGFEIPGELGLEMYSRDFSSKGRTFVQIDGRSSAQDLDIRARLLGGDGEDAIARVDAQIRDVPPMTSLAYAPPSGPYFFDPTFRLRAEILGEPKEAPKPTPSGGAPPKEDECTPLLCIETQVQLESVNAQFDFRPKDNTSTFARRLEAVIHTDGATNGLEIRAFDSVNGDGAANFLAGAQLSVDPINIFVHAGVPLLASLDFVMMANLDASVSLGGEFASALPWAPGEFNPLTSLVPELVGDGVSHFELEQSLLKFETRNEGDQGSRIGPIDFHVGIMHGEAWGLFVKLIGVDFVPPNFNFQIPFLNCAGGGIFGNSEGGFTIPANGSKDVVAWPFGPPHVVYSGVLGGLFTLAGALAGPFFCLIDADQELMEAEDSNVKIHPADPLGSDDTGSQVPGAMENDAALPAPPPSGTSNALQSLTVDAGTPALCGTHTFNNLTVPATLTLQVSSSFNTLDINGDPDDPDDLVAAACPDGATRGELTIVAAGTVTVGGTIQATGSSLRATNASGNGGGGHGVFDISPPVITGFGGNGGNSGSGGLPYGDLDDPFVVDTGTPGSTVGGGTAPGAGGGVIKILADVLDVQSGGAIRADGGLPTDAANDPSKCAVPDDADTEDVDESAPNTGTPGGGGGSGGGIVIDVAEYKNAGAISANGGNGGRGTAGAGGGGAGGIVKIGRALSSGPLPTVTPGLAGADVCPADFPAVATNGQTGYVDDSQSPRSRIDVGESDEFGFWHSTQPGKSLVLPYRAAAQPNPANDYQVVLCHTHRTTLDPDVDLSTQLMPLPVSPPTDPWDITIIGPQPLTRCGTMLNVGASSPVNVGTVDVVDAPRNTGTLTVMNPIADALQDGYHGFYTMLWKSAVNGNDCFDPNDMDSDDTPASNPFEGADFDNAVCSPEAPPTSPDIVLGVDNDNPVVKNIEFNGTQVTDGTSAPIPGAAPVAVSNTAVQVSWSDEDTLSQVAARQCTPDAPTESGLADCTSGQVVNVASGDGIKTIGIRVTDKAGNTAIYSSTVQLDTTIPASDGEIVAGSAVLQQNGWYFSSPSFRLFDFDDFGGTGADDTAADGDPPLYYDYQFDEGDVHHCETLSCTVSDPATLPGIGRHALRWTAIDKVGNQLVVTPDDADTPDVDEFDDPRPRIDLKIDGVTPDSELLSVPASPNGANGWYSGPTWVTFGAFDQPGASGFEAATIDDPDETQIGGVYYTTKHNNEPTSSEQLFNVSAPVPIRLEPGTTEVCWYAKDQAGNTETSDCRVFKVDEGDPTTTLPTTPNSPNGGSGWYKITNPASTPKVDPTVTDALPDGSGVGSDTVDVCTQRPLIADPAPTGTCVSVDGSTFFPVEHLTEKYLLTLGEGRHEVRAFATDAAGRRSPIVTRLYKVDLSKPVAVARTIMPRASAGKWWRHVPTVVLRAADGDRHGSGVAKIQYRFSGTTVVAPCTAAPCDYTKPFDVPQGVYRITYWATDAAGNAQPAQTLKLAVDTTPPIPKALAPNPALWLRSSLGLPLTSPTVDLKFSLQENLSGIDHADNNAPNKDQVSVKVVVYDVMGYPVRTLSAGNYTVKPGQTVNGLVKWDGKGANLTSLLPLGVYYYRVVATDAAGNPAMSGESPKLLIALNLLL